MFVFGLTLHFDNEQNIIIELQESYINNRNENY